MEKNWRGLPFRPISEFYKEKFGSKVYKIPVATAEACPNRLGLKGMQTCSFCDVWGSAARAEALDLELEAQIEKYKLQIGNKFNSKKFLIYFQAYTSTFSALPKIRKQFELAVRYPEVLGIVIGTRPDCVSSSLMQLWEEFHQKTFVSVEMGVQTFDENQLVFLRRGHTAKDSIATIERIAKQTSVDQGIHLMFGLPGETDSQMIETAKICNDLPIQSVKLHNLHILKNTELEKQFHSGLFAPIEREAYARRVQLFLEHLSPRIFIHRLAAFSSRWDELVAPAWTGDKMGTYQFLIDFMRLEKSHQGKYYSPNSAEEKIILENLALRSVPLQKISDGISILA